MYTLRGLGAAYSTPGRFTRLYDGRYQVEFSNPDGSKTYWYTTQRTLPGETSFVNPPSSAWANFISGLPADNNIRNWATTEMYDAQFVETGTRPSSDWRVFAPMLVGSTPSAEYTQIQTDAVAASKLLQAGAAAAAAKSAGARTPDGQLLSAGAPAAGGFDLSTVGGFDLGSIPWWGWAAAAGAAFLMFGQGGKRGGF